MVWYIQKLECDGLELLPDVVDTPLWSMLDPDAARNSKKSDRQLAGLYGALAKRENYFQNNVPTAFGNPDYEHLAGIVCGYLMALEALEEVVGDKIVIRKENGTKLFVVDKLNRPRGYYKACRDNRKMLDALGF